MDAIVPELEVGVPDARRAVRQAPLEEYLGVGVVEQLAELTEFPEHVGPSHADALAQLRPLVEEAAAVAVVRYDSSEYRATIRFPHVETVVSISTLLVLRPDAMPVPTTVTIPGGELPDGTFVRNAHAPFLEMGRTYVAFFAVDGESLVLHSVIASSASGRVMILGHPIEGLEMMELGQ